MASNERSTRGAARGARAGEGPVMADVAELAGVSVMTVSRVINSSAPVSENTRQRVQEAIAELGYRANVAARTLAGGRSRVLGAIGVETTYYGPSHTLFGIEGAAREAGHALSFVTLRETTIDGMRAALEQLNDAHVEAVIALAPIRSAIDALAALEPRIPIVVTSDAPLDMSTVGIDQYEGGRMATRHLLDLGHATVHHIRGPEGWVHGEDRTRGWEDELRQRGCEPGHCLTGDWSPQSGYEAARVLGSDPTTTAIFAGNDQMALGAQLALHDAGRRVPHDVSVVGYDDTTESAFFVPPLTTVRQDFTELGRRSVAKVLAMLSGEPSDHVLIEPELVVRRSTAPPPS